MSTFRQRLAAQWLIVAITSCLAILCFLAALYRKLDLEHIGSSSSVRRHLNMKLQSYEQSQYRLLFQQTNDTTLVCNGHVNLCDRRVNETIFATVHNAMSSVEDGAIFLKNHVRQLETALQSGYRGINLDIGICNGRVSVIHTICTISTRSLENVLQSIVSFLRDNPFEVILLPSQLSTQILRSRNNVTLRAIDDVFRSVPEFYNMLYNHPSSPNHPWPTLRDLIISNHRILFFHYNGESCTKVDASIITPSTAVSNPCPHGFHPWFLYAAETEFDFRSVNDLQDTPRACRITRGGGGYNQFFGINIFITPARFIPTLKQIHRYAFVSSHIDECLSYNDKRFVNVILVNYWGVGDVLDVVNDLNANLPAATEMAT